MAETRRAPPTGQRGAELAVVVPEAGAAGAAARMPYAQPVAEERRGNDMMLSVVVDERQARPADVVREC